MSDYWRVFWDFQEDILQGTKHIVSSSRAFLDDLSFPQVGYVTPLKINMEPKKWRFGRFFFLFNRVMFRFQPLIFRGVMKMATNRTSYYLRKSIGKPNHSHILLKKKQPLSKPIIISNNCLEKTTFYHRNSEFSIASVWSQKMHLHHIQPKVAPSWSSAWMGWRMLPLYHLVPQVVVGTPYKWRNFMVEINGRVILTTGSNWDDPPSS